MPAAVVKLRAQDRSKVLGDGDHVGVLGPLGELRQPNGQIMHDV
jgi:hypothetical protein